MRHAKHRYKLGRKKEHREALMANLASALFIHGRIQTTLTKAKALRPFAEKLITRAKRGAASGDRVEWLHHYRLLISKLRNESAAKQLLEVRVSEFLQRNGGYTRIYKLLPRKGDASPMGIIELIPASDAGYEKRKARPGVSRAVSEAPGSSATVFDAETDQVVAAGEVADEPVGEDAVAESPAVAGEATERAS